MPSARIGGPDLEALELGDDIGGEIDRDRAPTGDGRKAVELGGDLIAHLEAASTNSRAYGSADRGVAGSCHLGPELGEQAGAGSPPPGVGNADRVGRLENHPKAICGEHRQRKAGYRGPQSISFTAYSWIVHPVNDIPVHLADRGPDIRQVQRRRYRSTGSVVQSLVTVPGFGEGDPVHAGGADHP
jgi:hypothetical protein